MVAVLTPDEGVGLPIAEDLFRPRIEREQAAHAPNGVDVRAASLLRDRSEPSTTLRQRFFVADPSASDADYERLAPRLLDDEMVRRATESRDADVEELRARSVGF